MRQHAEKYRREQPTRKVFDSLDKEPVSRFLEHANQILDAAESAGECSPITILLGPGDIRIIAESDWPLDSLLLHHGAEAAYRVSGQEGFVRVEGRQGRRRCLLESSPTRITRALLHRPW